MSGSQRANVTHVNSLNVKTNIFAIQLCITFYVLCFFVVASLFWKKSQKYNKVRQLAGLITNAIQCHVYDFIVPSRFTVIHLLLWAACSFVRVVWMTSIDRQCGYCCRCCNRRQFSCATLAKRCSKHNSCLTGLRINRKKLMRFRYWNVLVHWKRFACAQFNSVNAVTFDSAEFAQSSPRLLTHSWRVHDIKA